MLTQAQWSAGAVVLAVIPIIKFVLSVALHRSHSFRLQGFAGQIQKDKRLTALPISISTVAISNLGELFNQNPAILRALDNYAEYGRMILLSFEASVLGLLSITMSLIITLGHPQLRSPGWWVLLFFKVVVLVWLGGWLLDGYTRYSKGSDDPAKTTMARKYWHRAVAGDAASALLEIFH